MLAIAQQSVTTHGINWESIAVIAAAVLAIVGAFSTWVGNKISHSINDLTVVLEGKLETKDVVNAIDKRLVKVEQVIEDTKGLP